MTDLIFHLGLTKNASTFFQHKVLFGKMYTLGRAVDYKTDRQYAKEFIMAFTSNPPIYFKHEGIKWFEKYNTDKALGPVIISHESLYEHVPFGNESLCLKAEPGLLSSRLQNISKYAWPHGKVKAWFFFRRQTDWLASIYAHVCHQLPNPSQEDFELRATEFIKTGHVVDYCLLFDSLVSALGEDNVLALPFEAMGEEWAWEKIRDFTGEEKLVRDSSFDMPEINVKRKPGELDWKANDKRNIKKYALATTIYRKLNKYGIKFPDFIINRLKKRMGDSSSGLRIHMPQDLEEKIAARYNKSNKKLSSRLGVELSKYNYYK